MNEEKISYNFISNLMPNDIAKAITQYIFEGLNDNEIIDRLLESNKKSGRKTND